MPLIIGTTPHSQWQALTPLLNHLGWENQQENPEAGYQNTGNVDENTQYLLLHSRPELAVAHAMDAGASPEEALAEWRTAAEQLLSFYKQHRRSAVMVDTGSGALAPRAVIDWLRDNRAGFYDLTQASWPEDAPELSIPAPSNPLHQLLATQLVAQDQSLAGLLAQLEAASVPLTDSTQPELDVAALHSELEQQKNAPQWEQDCAQAKAELSKTQAENNRLNQTLAGLQAELTQTKAQLEKASHAHETTAEQQQALKQESDLLLNQLHKVQEELENYYHKAQNGSKASKELEAQAKQLAEQKQALEAELQATQSELTQQKSAAEAAEEALSNARSQSEEQHKDVLEENEMVLQQLFTVQDELERKYLENQGVSKRLENAQRIVEKLSAAKAENVELKKSERKLKDKLSKGLKIENDKVLKQLMQVQKELTKYQDRNRQLSSDLRDRDKQNEALNVELRQAIKENQELAENLQLLQASLNQASPRRSGLHVGSLIAPVKKLSRSHRLESKHIELVRDSELFDAEWYRRKNPDVAAQFAEPAEHYVRFGGQEGRAASEQFDSKKYLQKNPDVAQSGLNPLVHYLLHGKAEGRKL